MSDDVTDAGFDEWIDALEADEAYYLACPDGHGSLPPRRICPTCGSTDLTTTELPTTGTVETVTITHVPTPAFADDAPYATAIADFGPVRLTGAVIDVDPDDVGVGTTVEVTVSTTETGGESVVCFRLR